MKDDLFLAVESHVKTLVNRFKGRPYNFFTESDIHSYLYLAFYRDKRFSKQYPTADPSVKTILIHREYPTFFRFRRKRPLAPAPPPARRGHYDLVVLNPVFLAAHPLSTVTNQDWNTVSDHWKDKPLLAGIEFKMPRGKLTSTRLKQIEIDFQKLRRSSSWCEGLYMLIFNRHERMTAKGWVELERMAAENPDVKAVYMEYVGQGEAKMYQGKYLGDWRVMARLPSAQR